MFDTERARSIHYKHLANHTSPSITAPLLLQNAHWSSIEKASFFLSLVRHSRWRPDIIADDIGNGKTVADVCTYIQLLEQASASDRWDNQELPTAREVSEEWIKAEESMAERLREEEEDWKKSALKRKRAEQRREVKKALRAERDRGGDIQQPTSDQDDEESWEERFKRRKKELKVVWKREDLLSRLSGRHLKTLEIMVNASEQAEHNVASMDDGNLQTDSPIMVPISESHQAPVASYSTPASQLSLTPIDHPHAPASPTKPDDHASGRSSSPVPMTLPPALSPTSRRRLQKRLWMRRKRALLGGIPASEVSTDVGKLKPGPKRKPIVKATDDRGSVDPQTVLAQLDSGPSLDVQTEHGREEEDADTKMYALTKFEAVDLDAAFLRTDGLDLFHLGRVGRLSSFLKEIHTPGEDDGSTPTLPYPLLLLLRAHLVHFLARLIACVIVQKEVDSRQKRWIKGIFHTGGAQEIKAENVHEVLATMGHELTSKRFFKGLKSAARASDASSAKAPVATREKTQPRRDTSEGLADSDRISDSSEDGYEPESGVDRHMNHFTDQRALPPSFIPQSTTTSFWNPILISQGEEEEVLLSEVTDNDVLEKELREEEEVERVEREADVTFEHSLWEEIGVERQAPAGLTEVVDLRESAVLRKTTTVRPAGEPKGTQSLRFRAPGGAVKSRVYIDSDEDGTDIEET